MELSEFKIRKKEMELRILHDVALAMKEFREKTGYSPERIDINLIEVTSFLHDTGKKEYIVTDIKSDVEI
jgi:hypothetical protein